MKRERTKYLGVYERLSDKKIHSGRADICYDITYKREGKKIWEKVGWVSEGYSAKIASELRSNRIRSIRHGEELPKEKQKTPFFKAVACKYLEWAAKNKSREGRDDESRYRLNLAKVLDNKRLNEISPFMIERLKNDLSKKDLAPGSVKQCLVLVRQIFNKAVLWGMYKGENPIKGVKLPILQNQRERFLSHEEAEKLLDELEKVSYQLHDMALISLHCGLRAGEIFNLKGQDIDIEHGIINISDPKNGESRKAFMTNAVKEILEVRKPEAPGEYVFKERKSKESVSGESLVSKKVINEDENKINSISAAFGRTIKRLGFNNGITDRRQMITFHSLRHTFASWLALQGETIFTIKELLGHKTLAMTIRYAHLMPEHKRQATLNLEKAFNEHKKSTIL